MSVMASIVGKRACTKKSNKKCTQSTNWFHFYPSRYVSSKKKISRYVSVNNSFETMYVQINVLQ